MKYFLAFCLLVFTLALRGQTLTGLDPSFGNHGVVLDSGVDGFGSAAFDMLVQPDGRIITVGRALNRYLPNGAVDNSFAGSGTVPLPDVGLSLQLQIDGRIIATVDSFRNCLAMRFYSDGTLDTTYGAKGIARSYFDDFSCTALQPDGKLLVAGEYGYNAIVRRFKSDGQPDSTFGTNGFVLTPQGGFSGNIAGVAVMTDGRIVIGGIGYNANVNRAALVIRYLPNGALDTTLNHNGVAFPIEVDYCRIMILQSDSKPLLSLGGLVGDAGILRLNVNGSIDSTYGQDGFATVPSVRVTAMKMLTGNKLLCGGYDGDFVLARLKAEGLSLDSTFGQDGVIRTDMSGTVDDRMYAMAVQQDNKIVTAGESGSSVYRLTLARYFCNAVAGVSTAISGKTSLFPNPAHNQLYVDARLSSSGYFRIISLEGRLLVSGSLQAQAAVLDISRLNPGTYFLSISTQDYSHTQLFTKQ